MPIPIQCPTCRRQLNVPEELRGRQVKCAECSTTFVADPLGEQTIPTVGAQYEGEAGLHEDQKRAIAASSVKGPAIGLILVAILNGLIGAYLIASGSFSLALDDNTIKQVQEEFKNRWKDVFPPELEDFDAFKLIFVAFAKMMLAIGAVWDGFALLVLIGAVQMLRLRARGFALFASILVMVPIISFVFLLGIPIGIWSLIVLSKPEVVAAFQSRPRS